MDWTKIISLGTQAMDMGSLLAGAFGGKSAEEQMAEAEGHNAQYAADTQAYLKQLEIEGMQRAAAFNSMMAEQDAQAIEMFGATQAEAARKMGRRAVSSQTAAFAAAGVDVGTGSPLEVYGNTFYESERQATNEEYNAATTAKRIRLEAEFGQAQVQEAARLAQFQTYYQQTGARLKSVGAMNLAKMRGSAGIMDAFSAVLKSAPSLIKETKSLLSPGSDTSSGSPSTIDSVYDLDKDY
jgi:hypothetical protein